MGPACHLQLVAGAAQAACTSAGQPGQFEPNEDAQAAADQAARDRQADGHASTGGRADPLLPARSQEDCFPVCAQTCG